MPLLTKTGQPAKPLAPFDILIDGKRHRITRFGRRLSLVEIAGGEPTFTRYLQEGELERFWEARIK